MATPLAGSLSRPGSRRSVTSVIVERIAQYALLVAALVITATPFVWMCLSAFKPDSDLQFYPPNWVPTEWTTLNLETAWSAANFARFFVNSTFVASVGTCFYVATTMAAGYAFARLDFPWKNGLFAFVMLLLMIPWPVTIVPAYLVVVRFPLFGGNDLVGQGGAGMLDSYWALILPVATGSFGIFLFRQFFRTLPPELEDAARIDGASEPAILWHVMMPLSGAAIATVGILHFQHVWNSFLWPYLVTNNSDLFVLQVGLRMLTSQYNPRPFIQMAGTLIATVPVVLVFFVGQRWFVRGIQLTGFK
jgi:multiple sugar transport system permease protein